MIARLKGILEEKSNSTCIVDVNGVGYEVNMPTSDLDRLPKENEPLVIYTWYLQREDRVQLYGFLAAEDRNIFKMLLGVNGIGPKAALAVLSGFTKSKLEEVIMQQNITSLSRLPGIGKKTAERLLLELKDKIKMPEFAPPEVNNQNREDYQEATSALMALGYSMTQARNVLQKVLMQVQGDDEIIKDKVAYLVKQALKYL